VITDMELGRCYLCVAALGEIYAKKPEAAYHRSSRNEHVHPRDLTLTQEGSMAGRNVEARGGRDDGPARNTLRLRSEA
jgi:hypothetical protein